MILRDSINASLIPTDTPVVAGYGDGTYEWKSADWARFPNSIALSIVAFAADQGDILDVERGDASPADVPGWIDRFRRPGRRGPTIYCSRDTIAAVRQAAGPRPFDWWAATLDGTQDVPGAVAVQYVDLGGYDESVVLDPSWVGGFLMALTDQQQQQMYDQLCTSSADPTQPTLLDMVVHIFATLNDGAWSGLGRPSALQEILAAVQTGGGALTAAQAQQLSDVAAAAARIETALKGA